MSSLQLVSRAVVISNNKFLLVKKRGADFWHYPGGKWEFEKESLTACAIREVKEETGLEITVENLLWCQEIRKPEKIYVELFWKAKLLSQSDNAAQFTSEDEDLEKIAWLGQEEMEKVNVLPKVFI